MARTDKSRSPALAYLRTSSAANVGTDKDSDKRTSATSLIWPANKCRTIWGQQFTEGDQIFSWCGSKSAAKRSHRDIPNSAFVAGASRPTVALAFLTVLVRADVATALASMMLWPPQSEHIAVFTSGKEPQWKTDVRTLSFLLLVAGTLVATVAAAQAQILEKDGSVQIAGHLMRCSETPVVLESNLPTEGMFIPGEAIYLNPQLMQHHPGSVRMFVFKHECAHKLVGGNELAADCSAAQAGAREHWLTQTA
jgi:hypothetical protein